MFCPNCGNRIDENNSFCNACGFNIQNDVVLKEMSNVEKINTTTTTTNNNNNKSKKNNSLKYILLFIGVLVIIIGVLLLVINKFKPDDENKEIDKPLIENGNNQSSNKKGSCDSGDYDCHTVKVYYLEATNTGGMGEQFESFLVKDGTVLFDNDVFYDILGDLVIFDGTSFYVEIDGFKMDIAWYYKGTDQKFDWYTPITKDIELEMKMFDGSLDNDFFEDLSDYMELFK